MSCPIVAAIIASADGSMLSPGDVMRAHKKLGRLERRAKDWAKEQVGFVAHTTNEALKNNMSFGAGYTVCKCCSKSVWSDTGQVAIIHAHDCDAAHILGLERESE